MIYVTKGCPKSCLASKDASEIYGSPWFFERLSRGSSGSLVPSLSNKISFGIYRIT